MAKEVKVLTGLGPLENRIMELLWAHGEASVSWAAERLPGRKRPAYTTVMTVMARLTEKGLLRRQLEGRAYIYEPAKTKEEFLADQSRTRTRALVRDFGEVALAHFVREIEGAGPRRLKQLQKFLQEAEGHERT